MGCDIHLWQEAKIQGRWYVIGRPDVPRLYALFERMAGVRGSLDSAMAAPRGLPDDISLPVQLSARQWGGDGHSHSWLDHREVAQLEQWWERYAPSAHRFGIFGYFMGRDGWTEVEEQTEYPEIQDVRWVFWFDN